MGLFANITGFSQVIAFFYITAVLKNEKETISKISWAFIFFLISVTFYFNLTPGLTVIGAKIFPDGNFQLLLGNGTVSSSTLQLLPYSLGFIIFL